MAYTVASLTKDDWEFKSILENNFPSLKPEIVSQVHRIHWTGSDFGDPSDWNLFVLYDKDSNELASKRVLGY